jgi:hypothetical protein
MVSVDLRNAWSRVEVWPPRPLGLDRPYELMWPPHPSRFDVALGLILALGIAAASLSLVRAALVARRWIVAAMEATVAAALLDPLVQVLAYRQFSVGSLDVVAAYGLFCAVSALWAVPLVLALRAVLRRASDEGVDRAVLAAMLCAALAAPCRIWARATLWDFLRLDLLRLPNGCFDVPDFGPDVRWDKWRWLVYWWTSNGGLRGVVALAHRQEFVSLGADRLTRSVLHDRLFGVWDLLPSPWSRWCLDLTWNAFGVPLALAAYWAVGICGRIALRRAWIALVRAGKIPGWTILPHGASDHPDLARLLPLRNETASGVLIRSIDRVRVPYRPVEPVDPVAIVPARGHVELTGS